MAKTKQKILFHGWCKVILAFFSFPLSEKKETSLLIKNSGKIYNFFVFLSEIAFDTPSTGGWGTKKGRGNKILATDGS